MLEIINNNYEDERKIVSNLIDEGKIRLFFQNNNEYWLKIKVNDAINADDFLMGLLYNKGRITGREMLGFDVSEIALENGVFTRSEIENKLHSLVSQLFI